MLCNCDRECRPTLPPKPAVHQAGTTGYTGNICVGQAIEILF